MIVAALVSGAIILKTDAQITYHFRNANVMQDAMARTYDVQRERGFKGLLPVAVVSARYASSAALRSLGFRFVHNDERFLLVETKTQDPLRRVLKNSYAYDPSTHLLRFERHTMTTEATRPASTAGPCPQ